jgi:hypothetical protein
MYPQLTCLYHGYLCYGNSSRLVPLLFFFFWPSGGLCRQVRVTNSIIFFLPAGWFVLMGSDVSYKLLSLTLESACPLT